MKWKVDLLKTIKRAHFDLCALIPEVIREQDVQATCNILSSKWKHLLPKKATLGVSSPDGKFIVMVKEVLWNYFARMLIQSSFPMYGSYFVSWWYVLLAVQTLKGHFPAYN